MTNSYQISDSTGNQIIDAGIGYDDALRAAQSHADRTGTDWYLYEQGADESDYMTVSPTPETIHTTTSADGISHDDTERVRMVLGSMPVSDVTHSAQLMDLVDHAIRRNRIPADDRDAAYRACCEHLGVDA